jgi:hypothetical protein
LHEEQCGLTSPEVKTPVFSFYLTNFKPTATAKELRRSGALPRSSMEKRRETKTHVLLYIERERGVSDSRKADGYQS